MTLSTSVFSVIADDYSERRIYAGAKLFRTLLAADRNIAEKTTSDNLLQLGLIFSNNQSTAINVEHILQSRANNQIRNIPIEITSLKINELLVSGETPFAGIFITQKLSDDELQKVIQYSIDRSIIIYSPFEGDVERGILGGLSVEARVRPYINLKTMNAAGIHLKPFLIKVAKHYE